MAAINPTPMATVHIGVAQDASPSPPLTKADLVPPPLRPSISPVRLSPSPTSRAAVSSALTPPSPPGPRPDSREQLDARSDEGVATTLRMPIRIKAGPPSSVPPSYLGHDHGTPLSDIGEEESTPGSKAGRRSSGLAPVEPDSPTQSQVSPLGHKSRRSIGSSSESSDVGDWESFEPSKMMTGRLAADVAREDDDGDGVESRRNSIVTLTNGGEADEMAILNAKAERILANARLRLTSMEDNLTKARHSILLNDPSLPGVRTSPSMSDLHQPAGGLYRSISLASRKTKPLHLVSKTQQQVHSRGSSDTIPNNKLKALSMVPETRASSAQEYRRRYDSPQPPTPTLPRFMRVNGQSPTSSRSVNSPIREDHEESPSTVKTSPESPYTHGLGINTLARETKEDISMKFPASSPSPPPSAPRTVSSASTRSIKEHVTDLKGRIADLQTKAKSDKERRSAYQSRSTPSPFTNSSNPEQWYAGAPEYKEGGSPLNTNAGIGWSPSQDAKFNLNSHLNPVTPQTQKFLDGENIPSTGETARFDIRTDVNTPNLAERAAFHDADDGLSNADSIVPESLYEDAAQGFDDQDQVAASEEEQIYLNEVLEESLQEVEPDVPDATEDFIIPQEEAERHEDRLDAFDYENMFLHSALGNFAGKHYRDSGSSDTSSVATDRATQLTPTADRPGFDQDDEEDDEEEEEEEEEGEAGEYEYEDEDEKTVDLDAVDRRTTPTQFDVGDDQPTPTRPHQPKASVPWAKHPQRSQSVDSVSTVATFATATEGDIADDQEDEVPDEILKWGNQTGFPKPPFLMSPLPHSAPNSGRPTPLQRGLQSPIRTAGSLGSPVRSPVHSPVQSPVPGMAKGAQAAAGGVVFHRQHAAAQPNGLSNGQTRAPSTSISSRTAPPNSSVIIHHRFSPVSPVSPPPPPTAQGRHYHPTATTATPPLASPLSPPPRLAQPQSRSQFSSPAPSQQHPANTEILMESLIKLADPDFRVQASGVKFADIDKDLVLSLLRAVGTVCDGVLKAEKAGRPDEVSALRGQLDWGRRVLEGEGGGGRI